MLQFESLKYIVFNILFNRSAPNVIRECDLRISVDLNWKLEENWKIVINWKIGNYSIIGNYSKLIENRKTTKNYIMSENTKKV